jgi:hypothetical protein
MNIVFPLVPIIALRSLAIDEIVVRAPLRADHRRKLRAVAGGVLAAHGNRRAQARNLLRFASRLAGGVVVNLENIGDLLPR